MKTQFALLGDCLLFKSSFDQFIRAAAAAHKCGQQFCGTPGELPSPPSLPDGLESIGVGMALAVQNAAGVV